MPASRAEMGVIGNDLILSHTPILVEGRSVRLKGILAAQSLRVEVRCEGERGSTGRIETVRAGIPGQLYAQGRKSRVKPEVGGDRNDAVIVRSEGK